MGVIALLDPGAATSLLFLIRMYNRRILCLVGPYNIAWYLFSISDILVLFIMKHEVDFTNLQVNGV